MDSGQRLYVILIIIILIFPLGSIYASVDHRPYPEKSAIVTHPVDNVGNTVFIFTNILTIDEDKTKVVIQLEDERVVDINLNGITKQTKYRKNITVHLDNTRIYGSIKEDSYIQIYGDLYDESTAIDAKVVVVDYEDSSDYIYMYGTSILGALFAVRYFFQHWRINLRAGCFETQEKTDG